MRSPRVFSLLPLFFLASRWKPCIPIQEGRCRRCPRLNESNIQLPNLSGQPKCQVAAVSQDYKNSGEQGEAWEPKQGRFAWKPPVTALLPCHTMAPSKKL